VCVSQRKSLYKLFAAEFLVSLWKPAKKRSKFRCIDA
jgi:hypothetical protein